MRNGQPSRYVALTRGRLGICVATFKRTSNLYLPTCGSLCLQSTCFRSVPRECSYVITFGANAGRSRVRRRGCGHRRPARPAASQPGPEAVGETLCKRRPTTGDAKFAILYQLFSYLSRKPQ